MLPLSHLVQTGFGGFYDGIAHWALTPEDVMVVLAFSLLAALGGKESARLLVYSLPAAWLAGGAVTTLLPWPAPPAVAMIAGFGLVGLLAALDRTPPSRSFAALTLAVAALHGAATGEAVRSAGLGWIGLAGAAVAVLIAVSVLPPLLLAARGPVARIAMRVGGSWLTATALLMVGWLFRPD